MAKKKHWTQTKVGKLRMAIAQRKAWRTRRAAAQPKTEKRYHATITRQPKELRPVSSRRLAKDELVYLAKRGASARLVELVQEVEKLQAFLGVRGGK